MVTLTFGTLSDVRGLQGEETVKRLSLGAQAGDAGGPVFDASGNVMGMLLPREAGARQLPGGVNFAVDADVLAEFLAANGAEVPAVGPSDAMAPEDLTLLAADLTVLVSCWN